MYNIPGADPNSLPQTSIAGPASGSPASGWGQLAYQLGNMLGSQGGMKGGAAGGLQPVDTSGGGVRVPQLQPQQGGGGLGNLAGFAKLASMFF